MHVLKWWRIYPLKYKAISALISLWALGIGLLAAFALLDFSFSLINITTFNVNNDIHIWSIALVVIVGFPFVLFAYLDWSRKRVRSGDIEIDARLKDAVSQSKNKR